MREEAGAEAEHEVPSPARQQDEDGIQTARWQGIGGRGKVIAGKQGGGFGRGVGDGQGGLGVSSPKRDALLSDHDSTWEIGRAHV